MCRRIPYSAKVKIPFKGWVFKLLDTMELALDAKISSHIELNFGTPRYIIELFFYKFD
jgi:hypothetical protein